MFTTDEGEGWQQLGEGVMPSSAQDASHMLEGFHQMAEQSIHSVLGGASMPDLKDALNAMFGPQKIDLNTGALSKLPAVDFFDSGASSATSPLSGAETATAPTGAESSAMQASIQAAPTGGLESAGLQTAAPAPAGGIESTGIHSAIQAGPGTVETLHAPGVEAGSAMTANAPGVEAGSAMTANAPGVEAGSAMTANAPGVDGGGYFKPMQGAEATANVTDATSPLANIGKAFTDIMTKMGDMLGSIAQGPMGFLGGLLNFFLTIFSEILSAIGQALEETARAAASLAAEAWKKHLEAANSAM